MFLSKYYSILMESVNSITLLNVRGSPYHALGTEICEMISSYLQDSVYFQKNGDIVNQYASLGYAHGWLSAGAFLGLYDTSFRIHNFSDIEFPDHYDTAHLSEKTERYHSMLENAIVSVSGFPGRGSPLVLAADTSLNEVRKSFIRGEELMKDGMTIPALGYLCYGYGWLDTSVRAGLLQVHHNFHLFTTEF
ncbi:DUF357 domain-containing protein [Methanospirillum hungatei]|uniref:DUF357 domain-containing protein n=1 Tax=Methanospirillum hungatei TaxID=2203 RepID=UPI0026EF7981|nr:DUF357 domain-containing protein [Methanospirillum hungatei]MCA1915645.1 DUF357 domain-containing protein [Methanospirillum hungatei]